MSLFSKIKNVFNSSSIDIPDAQTIYFKNGEMYKVYPTDKESWYDARYLVSDGVKYDLDTIADAAAARGAEVALFGHTHIPHAEQRGNVFLFNPGSCGRCYTGADTYGILTTDEGKVVAHEHKEVPQK